MDKEIKLGRFYLTFGCSFRRIALGFSLDKYHFDIDFLFFWIGIEF